VVFIPKAAAQILVDAESLSMQLYTDLFANDPEEIALGLNTKAHQNSLSLYAMLKSTASMARYGLGTSDLENATSNILVGIGLT
jgi:hypothetical protein